MWAGERKPKPEVHKLDMNKILRQTVFSTTQRAGMFGKRKLDLCFFPFVTEPVPKVLVGWFFGLLKIGT